jgi:glutathione synthase
MDPIESINQDKDSTFMLMLEAGRRGHTVFYGQPHELWVEHDRPRARLRRTQVKRATPHFECLPPEDVYLDETDAVFMRKDPPFHMGYVFSTYILDLLIGKTLVINDPVGLKRANEKMYPLMFPDLVPRTLVTRDMQKLKGFLDAQGGQMIVKPWDGNGGRGVLLVSRGDRNLSSMLEISTLDGTQYVIAQQYVPEARLGDKRIILINGEPRGAILRVPSDEDNRGNIHVGARVEKTQLTERDREICAQIGPQLRQDGLLFVGIDILGNYLTEINVTSPTGIQEINALDGVRLEAEILDHVEDFHQRGLRRLTS